MSKKKMRRAVVAVGLIGALMAGCTSGPVAFRQCDMTNAIVLGESDGSSVGVMLFNFIPINQNNRFKNAYEEAVTKLGGTCLINGTIEEQWFWAYLLNGYIFKVKGTVVKEDCGC